MYDGLPKMPRSKEISKIWITIATELCVLWTVKVTKSLHVQEESEISCVIVTAFAIIPSNSH